MKLHHVDDPAPAHGHFQAARGHVLHNICCSRTSYSSVLAHVPSLFGFHLWGVQALPNCTAAPLVVVVVSRSRLGVPPIFALACVNCTPAHALVVHCGSMQKYATNMVDQVIVCRTLAPSCACGWVVSRARACRWDVSRAHGPGNELGHRAQASPDMLQ